MPCELSQPCSKTESHLRLRRLLSASFRRATLPHNRTSFARTSHRVARHPQPHTDTPGRFCRLHSQQPPRHRRSNRSESCTMGLFTNFKTQASLGSATRPSSQFESNKCLTRAPALLSYLARAPGYSIPSTQTDRRLFGRRRDGWNR
jgi:hypothetical protein